MLTQLLQTFFGNDKKKVAGIMKDIDFFYGYIEKNGQVMDEWYFSHVFTTPYWNYLHRYKWLNRADQDFLDRGILSILLFMAYNYLEGKGDIIVRHLDEIKQNVKHFQSSDVQAKKLQNIVTGALKLAEKKQKGVFDNKTNKTIFKSITWTLKNIVLQAKPALRNTKP